MAPAPEAPSSGGGFKLNLSKPGAKEYLIVGGLALGGALLYFWWKNRQAAAPAATTSSTGTAAPSTPTGLSTSQFLAWIKDHTSSTTTTTTPVKKTGTAEVPDVVGKKGEEARDAIESAGFKAIQVPGRTPKGESTIVTSQNPEGGRKAPKGSDVAISVKVDRGARKAA